MKVTISDKQSVAVIDKIRLKKLAKSLINLAGKVCLDSKWNEISIVLMDDENITEINFALLGKKEPTDVISLRYSPIPPEDGLTGEIWINVEMAAKLLSKSISKASHELALYLAHGIDHLQGAEDSDIKGRLQMRKRELRWLKKPEISDFVMNLIKVGFPKKTARHI